MTVKYFPNIGWVDAKEGTLIDEISKTKDDLHSSTESVDVTGNNIEIEELAQEQKDKSEIIDGVAEAFGNAVDDIQHKIEAHAEVPFAPNEDLCDNLHLPGGAPDTSGALVIGAAVAGQAIYNHFTKDDDIPQPEHSLENEPKEMGENDQAEVAQDDVWEMGDYDQTEVAQDDVWDVGDYDKTEVAKDDSGTPDEPEQSEKDATEVGGDQ